MTTIPSNPRLPYWQLRTGQHLAIALTTLALTSVFWLLFSGRRDFVSHVSIATAYPALFLTTTALVLGPWRVLRGRASPVSFDLRRDVGIWAGIMALLHTAFGLNVHLRGRMWLYFVDEHHRVRHDLFGFGNDTGAFAALAFLLLLAISNDLSLRRLGTRRWKSLQRWTYAAIVLTVLHGVAYQQIEKREVSYQVLLGAMAVAITGFQLAGWRCVRAQSGSKGR